MSAKPIPDGYHSVTPYLVIKDPSALINFAKKVFDAQVLFKMDTPDGSISHAEIKIGDSVVMMGQSSEKYPALSSMLQIYIADMDAAYAKALKAGAVSIKSPENQFYGDRTALVKDTNEIFWNLSTHFEDIAPEDMKSKAEEYYKSK